MRARHGAYSSLVRGAAHWGDGSCWPTSSHSRLRCSTPRRDVDKMNLRDRKAIERDRARPHVDRRATRRGGSDNVAGGRNEGLPWAYRCAAVLIRPLLLLLTKRDWRGADHLPREGGFVVAPNHISYADPLPFAHYMFDNGRAAYFLAKESVFRVRGVGWLLRKAGQIPVHRNSSAAADAFRSAVDAVRAGKVVAIFPEGTI